jgi:hypothetical protein
LGSDDDVALWEAVGNDAAKWSEQKHWDLTEEADKTK